MNAAENARGGIVATTAWGLFCACSWTWCIGMYVPRIMLERYGWAGFVAFAVPNVLGCAAFGYVLRTPARSRRLEADHPTATTLFSVVTVAFHLLFAAFIVTELMPADRNVTFGDDPLTLTGLTLGAAAVVYGAGSLLAPFGNRAWLVLTAVVTGVSVVAAIMLSGADTRFDAIAGSRPAADLIPLTLVLAFGLLLCPYLDRTFHRALQNAPSRHAFAVFGVVFAGMLVLTCVIWERRPPLFVPIAIAHLLAQSVFSVGAHLREIRESPLAQDPSRRRTLLIAPWAAPALFVILKLTSTNALIGEDWYLRVLGFFGLVFPLYVVVFVGPGRARDVTRRALRGWLIAVLLAAPFFEVAFVGKQMGWLFVPIAAGIAAFVTARMRPR